MARDGHPDARVVYVGIDPIVVAHNAALLTLNGPTLCGVARLS